MICLVQGKYAVDDAHLKHGLLHLLWPLTGLVRFAAIEITCLKRSFFWGTVNKSKKISDVLEKWFEQQKTNSPTDHAFHDHFTSLKQTHPKQQRISNSSSNYWFSAALVVNLRESTPLKKFTWNLKITPIENENHLQKPPFWGVPRYRFSPMSSDSVLCSPCISPHPPLPNALLSPPARPRRWFKDSHESWGKKQNCLQAIGIHPLS